MRTVCRLCPGRRLWGVSWESRLQLPCPAVEYLPPYPSPPLAAPVPRRTCPCLLMHGLAVGSPTRHDPRPLLIQLRTPALPGPSFHRDTRVISRPITIITIYPRATPTTANNAPPKIPVLLLKTKSTPSDNYAEYSNSTPASVPCIAKDVFQFLQVLVAVAVFEHGHELRSKGVAGVEVFCVVVAGCGLGF